MAKRTIAFAGWSPAQGEAASIAVDVEAVADRLDDFEPPDMPPDREDEPLKRGQPETMSPANPTVGRWAAVALEEDFEQAREVLAPLLARRQEIALAVEPGVSGIPGLLSMRRPASSTPDRWRRSLAEATAGAPPYYLLLVGGPDRFPFEVQIALEQYHATGRLDAGHAPSGALDWEGCRAWVEKLVRYEEGALPVDRGALLYSFATDQATRQSHAELSLPLDDWLSKEGKRSLSLPEDPVRLYGAGATAEGLCAALGAARPAVVVTASHGFELFDSPADPARWGALTGADFVGKNGTPLDADRARVTEAFAPGAVMLSFACFSAGVPAASAHRALTERRDEPIAGAPFTAALPRALLAHPRGPIAFAGHVDRATSESFERLPGYRAPSAFVDFLSWSLGGTGTLGRAMSGFREACGRAAQDLADTLSRAKRRPSALEGKKAIDAFVRYHDAAGYILLGDPVTRLACAAR
ncbi:MAG: hypothetical protein U0359_20725 [Byssovorax sp.]